MAVLDATKVPSSQSLRSVTPSDDWDVDGADEVPAEGVKAPAAPAPAASEWDLDEGWETNIPITPPVAVTPEPALATASELTDPPLAEEAAIDNAETVSLVADDDPEAMAGEVVEVVEVPASEESEEAPTQSPAGEAREASEEPIEATSDDLLSEIAAAERECERAQAVVDGLKARSKEAKTELEAAISKLRRLAREVANDSERPLVSAAAKPAAARAEIDPEDDEDEDNTDLEDSASEEVEGQVEQPATERGKPTRIRMIAFDPNFPQLPIGSEHNVMNVEADGDFTIQNPDQPNKEGAEILLSREECEVVAWEEIEIPAAVAGKIEPNSAAASQAKAAAKNSRPEDESWRKARLLEDIGLAPNLCELLAENPEKTIKTMGDLSDWTEAGRRLDEIPKIGPAKVTKIDEATDRYWAKWNARK